MTALTEDMNVISKAMAAGYVPGASPYACEISDALRGREVTLARKYLETAREAIKREEQSMNNVTPNPMNLCQSSHFPPDLAECGAQESTSMQRLRERVAGNTESLCALRKSLTDLRNRLGGMPPTTTASVSVAPTMPRADNPDVVGIITRINDSLAEGEEALNQIDEVMRSLRKLV